MPRIRPGRSADRPRLRAIQLATLAEPWPELLANPGRDPPAVYVLDAGSPTAPDVVAYAVVVGHAADLADPPVAYLPEFAVAPAHQGRGLGTRLMEGVLGRLADGGVAALRLTVHADDERARGFYDGLGFRFVERVSDHYEDGDGLVLERGIAAREAGP